MSLGLIIFVDGSGIKKGSEDNFIPPTVLCYCFGFPFNNILITKAQKDNSDRPLPTELCEDRTVFGVHLGNCHRPTGWDRTG